ncbi:LysR family transcriptional regulator [Halovulum dunhuangense]|uniref:LysR family transcriptional regulator n=1 Tax=Halovulum dunhuangense TaxID=1505036 RepID=UPI0024841D88|nr:LysR family transcriptional regulator [Halovulum dunhuangense]
MSALRALAALAEEGSMTGAGRALNVTHAAIGQQIRALEDRLGLALIARTGRSVELTPDGRMLAETLRAAFGSIAEAVEAVSGQGAARPLQITTTPMFAGQWLVPRLGDFSELYPDIGLMVNPSPELVRPEPGGIDIAIRFGSGGWPGVESELLLPSSYVIVAARRLVGDTPPRTAAEMLSFPWLQQLGTSEVADWLLRQGLIASRMRRITEMPGNLVLDGVRRGHGIAASTRAFVEAEIAAGELVLLAEDDSPGQGYHIVTRAGVLRPAARAFVAWLREQVQQGD